ncbi:unnamed protein product, partial [Brachionus calyciflorus]
ERGSKNICSVKGLVDKKPLKIGLDCGAINSVMNYMTAIKTECRIFPSQGILKFKNDYVHENIEYFDDKTIDTFQKDVEFSKDYDIIKFIWTAECEEAFIELKNALTSYPILRIVDPNRLIKAYTDSSGLAIGGNLTQVDDDGKESIVAYYSRILLKHDINYTTTEKE